MKVILCDNRLGGLLGFRRDIILHFADLGYEVVLVSPRATTNWDKVGKAVPCVRIIHVPMNPTGINPLTDLRTYWAYRRIFKQERPDIVFTYTIKPNIYGCLAASSLGIPVVSMLAGLGYTFTTDNLINRMALRFYRHGIRTASRVMVLNQMNYDTLLDMKMVEKDKLVLLSGGEGVSMQQYVASPADYSKSVTFLMVSRVLYDKGYTEFVQAAKVIRSHFQHVHFEILGPLAYDSPMGVPDSVLEADRTAGHFRYLGVTNDVSEYVRRQNVVVVIPSKYGEGLNRSLMEACALGRPVITTDIPGCRETVDGTNGYLVPKGDTAKLIAAMRDFLNKSNEEKVAMAAASRTLAEKRFDVQYAIQEYDRIVAQLTQA